MTQDTERTMEQRAAAVAWRAVERGVWSDRTGVAFCREVREGGMTEEDMRSWEQEAEKEEDAT